MPSFKSSSKGGSVLTVSAAEVARINRVISDCDWILANALAVHSDLAGHCATSLRALLEGIEHPSQPEAAE